MIKLFLDTNVVMDMLQRREPFFLAAANIFAMSTRDEVQLYVAPITYTTASFLIGKQDKSEVRPLLTELRKLSQVTRVDEPIVDQALSSDFADLEDAIQYFSACTTNIDYIITRNKKDFTASKIPVFSPNEFLNSYNSITNQ